MRDLVLLLVFGLLIRLLTFNGPFGSDDLVYFERASQVARGEWSSSNYNGALRYGFNLPAAAFIMIFGENIFAANLWPLSCSLIEICAVYLFACHAMNRRAGVIAGILLASAPLHIAVATRIHADPVVSMFVTVSFVLLYFGALSRRRAVLFGAGLCIGAIFWTKELAAVTWLAFLPMLWLFKAQWRNCLYVVSGVLAMVMLHGLLMFAIAGDPLHLVRVVLSAVKHNFVDGADGEDSPTYYLRYLFADLRHVGLLGILATASLVLVPRWNSQNSHDARGYAYVLIWWLGLLAVLSVFPVSFSPLRFPMKQSNYISLFLAPTALLAGMMIATLPRNIGRLLLVLCVALGLLLGALQQADYRVFTANTKALAVFSTQHPQSLIIGSTNNSGMGTLMARQVDPSKVATPIISFRDLAEHPELNRQRLLEADAIFTVIDRQTVNWFGGKTPVTSPLSCWRHELTLDPIGLGLGNDLARVGRDLFAAIKPLANALDRLAKPQSGDVYRVVGRDPFCGAG